MGKHVIFVYGTLKNGHMRHKHLMSQRYLGTAVLKPNYRMVYLSGYPALVTPQEGQFGSRVRGEVYEIDDICMQVIDKVEGTDSGIFVRKVIGIESHVSVNLPTDLNIFQQLENGQVEGYVYCKEASGARDCGDFWF